MSKSVPTVLGVEKRNPNFFPSIFLLHDDFEFMYVIYNLDVIILSLLT